MVLEYSLDNKALHDEEEQGGGLVSLSIVLRRKACAGGSRDRVSVNEFPLTALVNDFPLTVHINEFPSTALPNGLASNEFPLTALPNGLASNEFPSTIAPRKLRSTSFRWAGSLQKTCFGKF